MTKEELIVKYEKEQAREFYIDDDAAYYRWEGKQSAIEEFLDDLKELE